MARASGWTATWWVPVRELHHTASRNSPHTSSLSRSPRCLPVLGLVDGVQVLLGLTLQRPRQLVEHVGDLVHPAALLPGLGPDLVQRLPEAERAVAGRQLGTEGEPVRKRGRAATGSRA